MQRPVIRDTTVNSPGEIARRFASALHAAGLLGGPLAFLGGALGGRDDLMIWGGILAAVGATLHFTRARWRDRKHPVDMGHSATTTSATVTIAAPVVPAENRLPRILLLNAALAGAEGNSARLVARVAARLGPGAEVKHATLAGPEGQTFPALVPLLREADAWVIATGTHWDGWSSSLQKFLEDATPTEVSDLWLGKPVGVLVSEHSTGGKGVLSRLQGVLVTMGCWIPPLSGVVISKSAQTATRVDTDEAADYWSLDDLDVLADNLLIAARQPRAPWRVWPVDRANFTRVWVD